jgi:tripartite-type tricarboxylate transporter receptor subunit TctC
LATRTWTDEFSKALGVPVVVFNNPGGGGSVGAAEAAKADPDGYTLLGASQGPAAFSIALNPSLPYYTPRDFVPIGSFCAGATLIVVNSSSPFKTVDALLDNARKNPGKLNCGTAGVGVVSYFNFELVKYYAKVDITHVPFQGSPPAVTALLGNHVDLACLPLPPISGHLKAGRLRGLVTTVKLKEFSEIPLFSDRGLAEAEMVTWWGLFAPAKIPKEVHTKLATTFERVAKDPGVINKLEAIGYTSYYLDANTFDKLIRDDLKKMTEMVKTIGIKPE